MASLGLGGAGASAQEALEAAGKQIDRNIVSDRQYGDLSDLLRVSSHGSPSMSGVSELDYPALSTLHPALANLPLLSPVRRVPLPPELVEQFSRMQCNCMMGVFPEISRAWLTIDSDIFVWNYEDGSDLAYFDGLNETILSAGLVKPKPGIFQPHIKFLLCLTTPVDIVLLGVSFANSPEGAAPGSQYAEMHLLPDPLFSIPSDNTYILSVVGTDKGRIFLAGKDGCLYEVVYQAEEGWFSRRCKKLNHSMSSLSFLVPSFLTFSFSEEDPIVQIEVDNSRHVLYTRTEKGTLEVFDLGADGTAMGRVSWMNQSTIVQYAARIASTIDRSNFKSIVHISAVPNTDSTNIHLVAVTQTGVRLYFTTSYFNQPQARPSLLALVHVRLPPGFTATAAPQRPTNIHSAFYGKGSTLLASSQAEDSDMLWCLSTDTFPFQIPLMETQITLGIDGRTWVLTEVSDGEDFGIFGPKNGAAPPKSLPPVVVNQHWLPPKRYVVLSAQGSYLLNQLRPVDQLRQLLLSNGGPDCEEVEAFFKLLRDEQACATCLILACSKAASDQEVSEWATRAFFRFGGEAQFAFPVAPDITNMGQAPDIGMSPSPMPGAPSPVPGLQTPAASSALFQSTPSAFVTSTPANQQLPFRSPDPSSAAIGPEVKFSGKHNGICLYMARILGPLWESQVVFETKQQGHQMLCSTVTGEGLGWVLDELRGLRDFLEKNALSTGPAAANGFGSPRNIHQRMLGFLRPDAGVSGAGQVQQQLQRKYQTEAQAAEKASLVQIQQLVHRTCEVLGLWRALCEHPFQVVAAGLPKEMQSQLRGLRFRDVIVNGKEILSALITCLINRYLGDDATTDAISSRLREVCPSLYSTEDAVCSKANELLQSAGKIQSSVERMKMLQESLQLYRQISSQINLPMVCGQFQQVHFYDGVVELSLNSAQRRDPQGLALHHYRSGEPPEDTQGSMAFTARLECYKCVTDALGQLVTISQEHPGSPSVPNRPGPPPDTRGRLSAVEAQQYVDQMMRLALKSEDELFHVALYDWLVSTGLQDKLLEISSPYIEPYLTRAAQYQGDNIATYDLLWKYHEKSRNYSAAAQILSKLAERHSTDVDLKQRIEYLSRAAMCAKSSTQAGGAADGEFLHELEEKLEVARLQVQVCEALARSGTRLPRAQEALGQLNAELVDITRLYGDFADPFRLSECKLAIIHCAGHHDPTLVESLWLEIVQKELSDSAGSPADTRMTMLGNKLVKLGRTYASSDRFFPLAFLVKLLEKKVLELEFDQDWAFSTLLSVPVPVSKLLTIYDRLFKAKDPCWQAARRPLHVLEAIFLLLTKYATEPSLVPAYERKPVLGGSYVKNQRRQFTMFCLDCIASYLVEVEAMSSTEAGVQELVRNFRGLQARLERLL
ncbi:PREDICTED: nuclear pore complex protein Nup155-like isoform X1 [Branchiostoma belcheri]|uniref:Nuclear pore complex protein Nup155 n=1 Tax=Branchiostoma belcheri TaxID=7741 RepID=A0A6P4ZVX8_BRABE|nr:PREDICTED: nuclear pore complex protein Nup155-like isoform X1 [Branchiostoma belcheri]